MAKKLARLLCGMLAILLMFSAMPVIVSAGNDATLPYDLTTMTRRDAEREAPSGPAKYKYTHSTTTQFNIASGTAYMKAKLVGLSSVTRVDITITLQKKTLLLFWSNEQSWSQTFYSTTGTLSPTKPISGGTYRIKVDYKACSGSASESFTAYSANAIY